MNSGLFSVLKKCARKSIYTASKHSPLIIAVAGAISIGVGTVVVAKESFKAKDIIDNAKKEVDKIADMEKNRQEVIDYVDTHDTKQELRTVYRKNAVQLVKTYAPGTLLVSGGIASMFVGHRVLFKRYAAISLAYGGLNKLFNNYRKRVVDRFSEDTDKELLYGIKKKEIEVVDVNPKTGEATTRIITQSFVDTDGFDPEYSIQYGRWIAVNDAGDTVPNPNWHESMDMNFFHLKGLERSFNDILKIKGIVFLNDIYAALGHRPTQAGQVVGWRYDQKNPSGDNYIDFGMYETNVYRLEENNYDPVILLNFNVDGNVWKLM